MYKPCRPLPVGFASFGPSLWPVEGSREKGSKGGKEGGRKEEGRVGRRDGGRKGEREGGRE